jgi:hypothetical protein
MPRHGARILPFRAAESLFLFEERAVRVLGTSGTEAAVPMEDLKALLDYLDATEEPFGPPPTRSEPTDEEQRPEEDLPCGARMNVKPE